jgi:DNA-binding transcriptional LysR family regulator
MPIGLHHLRYFLAVAEEGHVTRAAARLHLSQPSLSAQIRYLEEQVGVALFERSPRGMILTPAGEAFAAQARASLAAASSAIEDARQAAVGTTGKLKIGFIVGTQIELTSRILQTFRERFPNVALEFAEHSFADPSAGLNTGDVDLAFVMPPIQHDGLRFEQLFEAPRVAVLPARTNLLAGAAPSRSQNSLMNPGSSPTPMMQCAATTGSPLSTAPRHPSSDTAPGHWTSSSSSPRPGKWSVSLLLGSSKHSADRASPSCPSTMWRQRSQH